MDPIIAPHTEDCKPQVVPFIWSNVPDMDNKRPAKRLTPTEAILRDNVAKLKGDATYSQFPGKIGQGSITRVLAGQNVRLSTLEAIAKGFRLQAWELLTPDLDPERPPARRIAEERVELEVLRQFRDDVYEQSQRMKRDGPVVDSGGPNSSNGSGKSKGSEPQHNKNPGRK